MLDDSTLLCKKDNESDFQYHRRIIYGKLVDGTLSDYDYTELSEPVYGKEFSGDVARRMMYGSKRTLDLLEAEGISNIDDVDILCDINTKMADLRKEKQKFFDQRREFNKVLTEQARWEHIEEELAKAANSPELKDLSITDDHSNTYGDREAVLVFSDWHYGMVADNVFNHYSTDICKKRVQAVVSNAIDRLALHGCRKLHILILGDIVHGGIHVSARVASEELVVEQLMHASEMLAQAISELSKYADRTYVYSTYGNHGRVIPDKKENIHSDNIERLIGWWLEQRLSGNNRITVMPSSSSEFVFIKAYGHDICASHGDIDNVKKSPRLLSSLMHKMYGKDIECVILGDKHHRESFEELGVVSMICGSLCGADDYANGKRLYSLPGQLLLIFDSDGLDAEYRLRCE